jgi:hypothetical protein
MDNLQFTDKELEYINAGIDDQSQNIHRRFNGIDNSFYLYAKLPKGTYNLYIKSNSEIKTNCYWELLHFGIDSYIVDTGIEFKINNQTRIFLTLDDVELNVLSLRKQAILNQNKLEHQNNLGL